MTRLWLVAAILGIGAMATVAGRGTRAKAEEDADAGEYGSITGQFVVEGEIPERKVVVARGDAQVKDAAICAADDILSETVVVDPKTKGIANVFVYLPKAEMVYPKLKQSEKKEVVFDQEGCRFVPHALFVRTDQTVVVKSNDNCAHNTRTVSIRNQPVNFALAPGDRKGQEVKCKAAEKQPITVECNIHNWMNARWLILDHPYAAISDKGGQFTIADLPAGEHELAIWHEGQGYIQRKFKVQVAAGKTTELGTIKVPAEKLVEKR